MVIHVALTTFLVFLTVVTNQLAPSAARPFLLSSILPITTGALAAEIHFAAFHAALSIAPTFFTCERVGESISLCAPAADRCE